MTTTSGKVRKQVRSCNFRVLFLISTPSRRIWQVPIESTRHAILPVSSSFHFGICILFEASLHLGFSHRLQNPLHFNCRRQKITLKIRPNVLRRRFIDCISDMTTMNTPDAELADVEFERNASDDVASPFSNREGSEQEVSLTMPPTPDEDEGHDGDTSCIYSSPPPPPRIAAPFYRPTQNRRKESAASSRRNSISSVHSRCSSAQAYSHHTGGPQSKHIAHHLRRTSFLEDRKARLADRAAHAEKVRLRAALAKAAPRGTSSLEERALAAQQAREKKLAEIVASCAEDVRKAKAVAESMKEKRERELARVRARMEERMAEADRRREELKNRCASKRVRGQSLNNKKTVGDVQASAKEKRAPKYSEDVAAGKIQWWWRAMLRRKALTEFNELGLTVEGIRDTSFDHVVELLAQERVLLQTSRILRICGLREGDSGSVNEMAALRTFLSAFLILGHPNQVLSNKDSSTGEQEQVGAQLSRPMPHDDLANPQLQDLVAKARDLLICFENISSHLTAANYYTAPPALQRSLPEVYATFHNAFIAWKSRDSDSLVQVMVMQFVELQMIWQTVKDSTDGASAEAYRESIKDNQVKLIVRIKKLAGPERGKKLISDALRQAKLARAATKPKGDMKPRVMENSEATATATAESFVAPIPQTQTLTPPATPSSSPPKLHQRPPQPITLGPGLGGLLPRNRVVVHELAINQEYRIPPAEYREHRAINQRPVFFAMRFNLEAGLADNGFKYFTVMMQYFKDSLQRLVKPGGFMHKTIGEVLDVELAERQFQVGSFSYEKFFAGISHLLPKLCAPYRDDECKDLIENKLQQGDLVGRVEALTEFVDLMLCDYVNYMLSMAAPQLIQAAPQYEAKRFAQDMEDNAWDLTAAVTAWRSARSKVLAETSKRDPEAVNHPKGRPTADKFYAQMLVDLFTQPLPVDEETVPEMLLLDYKRMQRLSSATQRIITAGAILLQCKNMLKRDVRSPWKAEATRVTTVLEANHENIDTAVQGIMAALEGGRSMPAVTKTHLRALVTKVLHASQDYMQKGEEPREPVLRLLLSRLRGHMFARLGAGSASEKIKAASTAGERLAGLGLAEFAPQVREIVDEIAKVGAVDRAAHGQWWEAVAQKVQQEDGASSAMSGTDA
ncbi:IQ calmodulin-binding motif domain-containing protein [Sodiomyces alkalinus F11]|uniref:IQ calmodulin-binding motif domain-containing protein n=1 Tax=Sodiomyces alkalinus (strain CBS 110278 / VKM F-3762 / F11) TaxID=1314773 RepID=A0A3N2Q6F7_SODAK|nr:IQ calmodulin-binding motif domain-containing protein [Sodiomyces alkalinus F11]ROT42373.1 IQ calmodulin-binding motif domain-containing protein [Sodiomyces alkalinus F11]